MIGASCARDSMGAAGVGALWVAAGLAAACVCVVVPAQPTSASTAGTAAAVARTAVLTAVPSRLIDDDDLAGADDQQAGRVTADELQRQRQGVPPTRIRLTGAGRWQVLPSCIAASRCNWKSTSLMAAPIE
jgi:hypothetical protein